MGIIMYVVLYALMLQKGYQESTGKREGGREVSNGERRDLKLLPSEVRDLKPVLAPPYSTVHFHYPGNTYGRGHLTVGKGRQRRGKEDP